MHSTMSRYTDIFSELIPEMESWLEDDDIVTCLQVCKRWNENLSKDSRVSWRLLKARWPLLSIFRVPHSDESIAIQLFDQIQNGLLEERLIFSITSGNVVEPDEGSNRSVPRFFPTNHYDRWMFPACSWRRFFAERGYRIIEETSKYLTLQRIPSLCVYRSVYEARCAFAERGFILWNSESCSLMPGCHEWTICSNRRLPQNELSVLESFVNEGYELIDVQPEFTLLYRDPEEPGKVPDYYPNNGIIQMFRVLYSILPKLDPS